MSWTCCWQVCFLTHCFVICSESEQLPVPRVSGYPARALQFAVYHPPCFAYFPVKNRASRKLGSIDPSRLQADRTVQSADCVRCAAQAVLCKPIARASCAVQAIVQAVLCRQQAVLRKLCKVPCASCAAACSTCAVSKLCMFKLRCAS